MPGLGFGYVYTSSGGGAGSIATGATLMKTGQTASTRDGDDGFFEAGRETSFLVLENENPFGNTNKLTDVEGGQTYTLGIVIDWSTFNGTTVLGYTKTISGSSINQEDAINGALATSIGSYTTGWRLTNRHELENLIYLGVTSNTVLNYAPFSLTTDLNVWSSSDFPLDTTKAYFLGSTGNGNIGNVDKTIALGRYYACRTFTVTGTTLT